MKSLEEVCAAMHGTLGGLSIEESWVRGWLSDGVREQLTADCHRLMAETFMVELLKMEIETAKTERATRLAQDIGQ
jgi:hypothetical protein